MLAGEGAAAAPLFPRIDAPARTFVPMRSTVAPTPIAGGRGEIVTSCGAFFDGGVFAMSGTGWTFEPKLYLATR